MYITKKGDTWDFIAFKALGAETRINEIMDLNKQYIDIVIFDAGVEINTPENSDNTTNIALPDWRK